MTLHRLLIPLISLSVFYSCQQDSFLLGEEIAPLSSSDADLYPNVAAELEPYFSLFEAAADLRGYKIDLTQTDITGTISEIHEDGVAGSCSYGGRTSYKNIVIDKTFWNQSSSSFKEYIIFHELGHCFLDRDHLEGCLPEGIWSSIMRSGTVDGCVDFYNLRTRDYYLDELFSVLR